MSTQNQPNYLTGAIPDYSNMGNWGAAAPVPYEYTPPNFGFDTQTLAGAGAPGSSMGSVMGAAGQPPAGGDGGFLGGMLGNTQNGITTPGWGGTAIGGISALGNAYLGMKQYGLAKDTLKHNKEMFAKNFDAQRQTTNSSLRDRQAARVASNSGAYQSVSDYMKQNEVR